MSYNITGDGNTVVGVSRGHKFAFAVSGTLDGTLRAQYATAGPATAALTTSLTGDDNDLVWTATNAGTSGNSLTVAYADPGADGAALSATMTFPDLVVSLATDDGDAATTTLDSTNANADVTVDANSAGSAGNAYSVELVDPSANDATLSVSSTDYLKFTVSLATDGSGNITSTSGDVASALNDYAPFAALMTATEEGTGAGVVEAIAEQSLAGGGDNYSITTTAAEIAALANADPTIATHLTAANASSNDGSGLVIALSETALSGGTAGTFVNYATGTTSLTAAGELEVRNVGVIDSININVASTTSTNCVLVVTDLGEI